MLTTETKLVYSEYFSALDRKQGIFSRRTCSTRAPIRLRGAYYKIHTLTEEEKSKGLITASAGNHAQGVAYASCRLA